MSSMSTASFQSFKDESTDFEKELSLNERLKVFRSSHFDPDAYVSSKCHTMNEKEIKHLCHHLHELKKASAEEMRKSVYANYVAFIRTSKEISDLEGELLSMRNLLSNQATLIQGLAGGIHVESLSANADDESMDIHYNQDRELSNIDKWLADFLETLEVLLAEKRVDEALAALDEGERIKEEANEKKTLSPTALLSLQTAINEQRQKLAEQLAETASQPSTRGAELRSTILALKKLGDNSRAHSLLLNCHHQQLQFNMQSLRSSSNLRGAAYTATLSRIVFTSIAQAASDSLAVFGEEPAFASELVTWAVKQTEAFALLLKRHVFASSAVAGGLRVAAESVHISLAHCFILEARGLALSAILLRHFRPSIEQAMNANLKKIEQTSAALAAAENWLLAYPPASGRPIRSSSAVKLNNASVSQPKLSSSAHKFISMVQEYVEDVGYLEALQFEGAVLDGLLQVFSSYVNLLIDAIPGSMENEDNLEVSSHRIVKMAETEGQQIGLLANALLLADELLPRAAMKLMHPQQNTNVPSRRASERQTRAPEQREWKRRLLRLVDHLRDSFCRQHALELIFSEDGESRLNALMYTCMDDYPDEPEWFPSPIFQGLFLKINRISSIASDMFVGRERFATILLMRLTETVVLWLSDDQNFWEEIEDVSKPLGPLGLRQLYLDMEFVILCASEGRYLSRNLHQVIKNIIERAIEVVASTGIDPYSVLPEEEWFADVAQIAIKTLSGKASFGSMDRDVVSPTASVSVSSVLSHGSN